MTDSLIESFPSFKVSMRIEGPPQTEETSYGPRERRDDLARFDVEVDGGKAWRIFQEALAKAVAPDAFITVPESMSPEEAERIRAEWNKRYAR